MPQTKYGLNRAYAATSTVRKARHVGSAEQVQKGGVPSLPGDATSSQGKGLPSEPSGLKGNQGLHKNDILAYLNAEMATDPRESLRKRFGQLVVEWKTGCGSSSDFNEMILHPAYQQIIGMGHAVLPLLFEELESAPDHWFWALTAITGVDPVLVQAHGFREAVEAWLAWGRVNKYL